MMGINFHPTYYIDISKYMIEKIKSISSHVTQKPERFVNLAKLMNAYRSAQCNAPKGSYAEAYFLILFSILRHRAIYQNLQKLGLFI